MSRNEKSYMTIVYVSPNGNSSWNGSTPNHDGQGRNGPMASISEAIEFIRLRRARGEITGCVTVALRGGTYLRTSPICLTDEDSNISFTNYRSEVPIIDGGVPISEWRETKMDGHRVWTAEVGKLLTRQGPWKSLYINGRRGRRPRLPKTGQFRIARTPGTDPEKFDLFNCENSFVAAEGDVFPFKNLQSVEAVVSHFWVDERMPLQSFDSETRLVVSERHAIFSLVDSWTGKYAKYHLENVQEALSEEGEWYLDEADGVLIYLPLTDESLDDTAIYVPAVTQLVRFIGNLSENNPISNTGFSNIVFRNTDWHQPEGFNAFYDPTRPRHQWRQRDSFKHFEKQWPDYNSREWASTPQAALHVPGAVHMECAHNCFIDNCTIQNIGWYGISMYEGCQGNRVAGNHIFDLGAGGIVIDGGDHRSALNLRSGKNAIVDNLIENNGHVWRSGCGICLAHSAGNTVSHNELRDLTYSGISVGWVWGFEENVSRDNRIEYNHIHDLAVRGGLSDLGAIYALGIQPGTVIRHNHIHDVAHSAYGGHGIYLDEGASCMLVEQNLVHRCSSQAFIEHLGKGNFVRDNIFAFCSPKGTSEQEEERAVSIIYRLTSANSDAEWPPSTTQLLRNVFLSDGTPMFLDRSFLLDDNHLDADLNTYWDIKRAEPVIMHVMPYENLRTEEKPERLIGIGDWQDTGMDLHSHVCDPKFRDASSGDFSLSDDSILKTSGFRGGNWGGAGPRRQPGVPGTSF